MNRNGTESDRRYLGYRVIADEVQGQKLPHISEKPGTRVEYHRPRQAVGVRHDDPIDDQVEIADDVYAQIS